MMYPGNQATALGATMTQPTLLERLKEEKIRAEDHSAKLQDAIEELETNPALLKIAEACQALGRY